MKISPSHLRGFRTRIEEAALSTGANLSRSGSFPWDLRVSRRAFCHLGDFPEQAVFCNEEMMASVLLSHYGSLQGTSVISLEPRNALELIRSIGLGSDPLESFRRAGASIIEGVLGRLGAAAGFSLEFGNPSLEERSLVATLLGTHAPRDTVVVSLELGFASAEQAFSAYLYLLLDPKAFQTTLSLEERKTQQIR